MWYDHFDVIALSLKNILATYKAHGFGLFSHSKKSFFEKLSFWKFVRKCFLRTSDVLCRYLECSSDSGISFSNIRMVNILTRAGWDRSWKIACRKRCFEKGGVTPKRKKKGNAKRRKGWRELKKKQSPQKRRKKITSKLEKCEKIWKVDEV